MTENERMRGIANISIPFFKEYAQIVDRRNKPLVNLYVSYADRSQPVYGTVYLMPGYGGSPVEPCMKLPMQKALRRGFDVVSIEGVALSATSEGKKNLSEMTLVRQKVALMRGLDYCRAHYDLCADYNIAWAHSISCRALSDLMVFSESVRNYFDSFILNNPYFLPPSKVQNLKTKLLSRDPSGGTWNALSRKPTTTSRQIENETFYVPACLHNLEVPLPLNWQPIMWNTSELVGKVSQSITNNQINVTFVLGTKDDMAEYPLNVRLYEALKIENKKLVPVDGAGHSFENALDAYGQTTSKILDSIIEKRREIVL